MRRIISLRFPTGRFLLRIVTFNANGLRSAARRGFFRWFARQRADVLCVQELKAHEVQLADRQFHARGFHRVCQPAIRPGYSGVALYTREEPREIVRAIGEPEFDAEGRYVEARFADVAVASLYFPSGSSSPARQEAQATAAELQIVYDASLAVVSDHQLAVMLQNLVERITTLLPASYAAVWSLFRRTRCEERHW